LEQDEGGRLFLRAGQRRLAVPVSFEAPGA
jgi:hypothetical protein